MQSFNLIELLKLYLDYLIFGVLGFMSFLMLAYVIERFIYYIRIKSRLASFQNLTELEIALTDKLTTISSIGANAPYVGLLGTVLGIMITFYDIGQGGRIDANTVMLGLALALKATAMGLLVAIPSILFYNGLLRKVEVLKARWLQVQSQQLPAKEDEGL
ncbi:TonB-system energizer ExbB [Candidatus Parabeggiatoa sp. HSG14]|uniref:TonB-system energizer ExbB n=1 Tax=Candidatus Parabeggiatoa sp. HSG14 TaxID=3055593 RepID=UPI0025A7B82F|nr:TonB-system energizer ExbB [Thiotrichales bacterium HSG14]